MALYCAFDPLDYSRSAQGVEPDYSEFLQKEDNFAEEWKVSKQENREQESPSPSRRKRKQSSKTPPVCVSVGTGGLGLNKALQCSSALPAFVCLLCAFLRGSLRLVDADTSSVLTLSSAASIALVWRHWLQRCPELLLLALPTALRKEFCAGKLAMAQAKAKADADTEDFWGVKAKDRREITLLEHKVQQELEFILFLRHLLPLHSSIADPSSSSTTPSADSVVSLRPKQDEAPWETTEQVQSWTKVYVLCCEWISNLEERLGR